MATIATYADPDSESIVRMGVSGSQPVLVSDAAEVEVELSNGFDKQRHKAKNFGRVKFLGIDLAKASISFTVMPDEETNFWSRIVPLIRQKGKTGNAPPLDIITPQLNRAGISTVTILKAKIGQPNSRDGRRVTIDVQEWAPAPSEPKKTTAAKSKFEPAKISKTLSAAKLAAKNS